MAEERVTCCGCTQQCGLLAEVDGGRVIRLRGDREHPTSKGFICPKGSRAHELLHDPSRLSTPLKRVGPRGSNSWVAIDWTQALDEIADIIGSLSGSYGPETLAYGFGTMHGPDVGLGERFMNLFGSPNTIGQDKVCYGPNVIAEVLTYGWGPTMYTFPVPGSTGCEVLWGLRPSASMPLLWSAICKARKAGSKLIVIDPQETHEARLAEAFLQVRPGTDAALALGLINVIIEEGLYDEEFVGSHTIGFPDLRRRAAEYPVRRVSDITGVSAEGIERAARMIAGSGPMLVHGGNGLCQVGSSAVQAGRALACLIAITGNIDVVGGHALAGPPSDILANGAAVLCDELAPKQRAKRLGGSNYPIIGDGYAPISEALDRAWGDKHSVSLYSSGHEPSLWQAIRSGEPYPIKALILQCHNAVGSSANAHDAAAALASENLELLVVQDMFMNKTASLADYVLPAAHWLEKPFYSAGYGYVGFSGDYVEAGEAAIAASQPSDYDLWRDLGRRLGQAERWPQTAEEFWDTLLRPAGLRYHEVSQHVGPLVGAAVRRDEASCREAAGRYGTPSGKVELHSTLLEQWGLDPLPCFEVPEIFAHAAGGYPLVLTTGGRAIEGFHQNAQQMSAFRERHPEPLVSMHPDTAAQAGIIEGDWVTIKTPIGSVRQLARLTDALAPGVVHADRWWYPERSDDMSDPFGVWATNINVCTENASGSCDPVMGSWLLRALPCTVMVASDAVGAGRPEEGSRRIARDAERRSGGRKPSGVMAVRQTRSDTPSWRISPT